MAVAAADDDGDDVRNITAATAATDRLTPVHDSHPGARKE